MNIKPQNFKNQNQLVNESAGSAIIIGSVVDFLIIKELQEITKIYIQFIFVFRNFKVMKFFRKNSITIFLSYLVCTSLPAQGIIYYFTNWITHRTRHFLLKKIYLIDCKGI